MNLNEEKLRSLTTMIEYINMDYPKKGKKVKKALGVLYAERDKLLEELDTS